VHNLIACYVYAVAQPETLRLENQLCFALHAASRAMTRAYAPALDPLGLTYPQYVVLLALWERDGVAVNEVGERLSLDSGTLSPLLRRMERDGLVTRARSPRDERQVNVSLTARGRRLLTRAAAIRSSVLCRADLTNAEGAALLATLRRLHRALCNPVPEPAPNRKKKLT
jgi:MarR family transcriptional regulator, organic hydroperoxide resistance regulator